jgi:hypothetical protein
MKVDTITMEQNAIGEVIGERMLTLEKSAEVARQVKVLLGKPRKFQDSEDFCCPYQIIGLGDDTIKSAAGIDSMQAIQIAMQLVASEIHNVHREDAANLRWYGNRNIGLPVIKDYFGAFEPQE